MLGLKLRNTMSPNVGISKLNVFVFHFDIVGFVDVFVNERQDALNRLRQFQKNARHAFPSGHKHTYVVTLFDNVWSRVNSDDPGQPSLLLKFAGDVMRAALDEGFDKFFGAVTRGVHDFDPNDRLLIGRDDFEDLSEQHIDVTSEPHIRAAYVERWARNPAFPQNCVWVSSDVLDLRTVPAEAEFEDVDFEPSVTSLILPMYRYPTDANGHLLLQHSAPSAHMDILLRPNPSLNADARRRAFARASVAG